MANNKNVAIIILVLTVIFLLGTAALLQKRSHKSAVSVICPVKDHKAFQEKLLPSLSKLSKSSANVIIISDKPESIAPKARRFHLAESEIQTLYDGFNRGIEMTNAPYIMFFMENDEPPSNFVEKILANFKENPHLIGVCPSYISLKNAQRKRIERHPFIDLLSGSKTLINGCTFRRDFLTKFNIRFDTAKAMFADSFFMKLLYHQAQIKIAQDATILHDDVDVLNYRSVVKKSINTRLSFKPLEHQTTLCNFVLGLIAKKDFTSLLGTYNINGIIQTYCPEHTKQDMPSAIPIGMSTDDRYARLLVTSITSVMLNAWPVTKYVFYIMHPHNFSKASKRCLLQLQKKFHNCTVKLIDMGGTYASAPQDLKRRHITTPAYYRLSLPDILPNVDKIIWLDGDTIVLEDLHTLFSIPMDGYYVKGFLDNPQHAKYNQPRDRYICDGVMLMNLAELRRDNITAKFQTFIANNSNKLVKHDQTVINVVCYKKIGVLPARFGLMNFLFSSQKKLLKYINRVISPEKYSKKELQEARDNPAIIHYTTKPWRRPNWRFADVWMSYAKRTDVYKELMEQFFKSSAKK